MLLMIRKLSQAVPPKRTVCLPVATATLKNIPGGVRHSNDEKYDRLSASSETK
jgi:hypothetical protein